MAKLFGSREFTGNVTAQTAIGHVNNIPTMQFFTGILRNTQSESYICYH